MKRFCVVLLLSLVSTACSSVTPGAGEQAVLVYKPWIFGHGGVDKNAVTTGQTWVAWSTEAHVVSTTPRQFNVHFEDMMSAEGVPLDFDAVIRLQVTDAVAMVEKFGVAEMGKNGHTAPAWYWNNVYKPFETAVRQAVRKHGMNETAISTTAIDAIDDEISATMLAYLKGAGLPVRLIDVTVGRANPPDAVKHQRVETAAQEQRSNTERQRKLAEDQRLAAEQARAAADNAYREAMRLSPDQFLQLEAIKMQRDVCTGGKCTFLLGGGAVPTLPVR
jgi:regulator of protease activity HflC (stomatin/prohibitin superfamily)